MKSTYQASDAKGIFLWLVVGLHAMLSRLRKFRVSVVKTGMFCCTHKVFLSCVWHVVGDEPLPMKTLRKMSDFSHGWGGAGQLRSQ